MGFQEQWISTEGIMNIIVCIVMIIWYMYMRSDLGNTGPITMVPQLWYSFELMHFKFVIVWFIWFIGMYLSISCVSIHLSRYLCVTFLSPAQLPWWRWCSWSMPAIYRAWGSPAAWCTIVGRRGQKGRSCWINTSPQATRRQHTSCQWLLESQPLSESTRHFFQFSHTV